MIVDLFAGPGGWSEGLRLLSPAMHSTEVGLEWDSAACRTRSMAGHRTLQVDIAAASTAPFARETVGLIASPPCQDFSSAGNRAGIAGTSGHLVGEVIRWASDLQPDWIALEEVPAVMPLWLQFVDHFAAAGYSAWAGILNTADYGVPQTRKRAVLIASRTHEVYCPPPTHCDGGSLMHSPWAPMSSIVGHDPAERALNTGRDWKKGGTRDDAQRIPLHRPCPTVTGQATAWQWRRHDRDRPDPILFTIEDAAAFQSFPLGYPVHGSKVTAMLQIGNAVPPLFAAHILAVATGSSLDNMMETSP